MEEKQANLLFKVLKVLDKEGILKHIIIIGSWSLYFYRFYYKREHPIASLRTRDVDFLIPTPESIKEKKDLPELLKGLGFLIDFRGEAGYIRLIHPEFFIEFLVPDKGKSSDKPFPLSQLGVNAQRLRYLNILYSKIITLDIKGLKVKIPHPACFLLHKIIILHERKTNKKIKDLEQIERIIDLLREGNKLPFLKKVFDSLHSKWQRRIVSNLRELSKSETIALLLSG